MESTSFDNTEVTIKRVDIPLVVDLIKPHIRSPKKDQAQIRMQVISTYPESRVGNSLNTSIFDTKDFGFADGKTFTENRVAWMDIPKGKTIEEVREMLTKFPKARIYKIMALEPILTAEQISAMENGVSKDSEGNVIDMAYYEKSQLTRPDSKSDEVLTYKGLPQYRITAFSINGKQDIDLREKHYESLKNENSEFVLTEAPVSKKAEVNSEQF